MSWQESKVQKWLVEFQMLKEQSSSTNHDLNKPVSLMTPDCHSLHITFCATSPDAVCSYGRSRAISLSDGRDWWLLAAQEIITFLRLNGSEKCLELIGEMFIFLLTEIKWRTFPKGRRRGRVWWWDHGSLVNWGPCTLLRTTYFTLQIKFSSVSKFYCQLYNNIV